MSPCRFRKFFLGYSASAVLYGLALIAAGIFDQPLYPDIIGLAALDTVSPMAKAICTVIIGCYFAMFLPLFCIGWCFSNQIASTSTMRATAEVAENIRSTDPRDDEAWQERVTQPALALCTRFKVLSDGWSGGVLASFLIGWIGSLGSFAMALSFPPDMQSWRLHFFVTVVTTSSLPLGLAYIMARNSLTCNLLMDELNKARMKHGAEVHIKIQWLETSLKQQVRRQNYAVIHFACL
eukprot:SAG31_NODE_7154_length_1772_cov_1.843395_1_plen_236_part_10